MANLESDDLAQWKADLDTKLKTLANSFSKIKNSSDKLKSILTSTKSSRENLSYRFTDLSKLAETAKTNLNNGRTAFDTQIDTYIKKVKDNEKKKSDAAKKNIDKFAETADAIGKIKWS